jgi:hypothetical protein
MPSTLLLFDVDGVLLYAGGYREALRATINYFAAAMGQPALAPTYDENAEFEACGITNEWDSIPMCVGALLLAALEQRPDALRATFTATLDAIRQAGIAIPRPDYPALARAVQAEHRAGEAVSAAVRRVLASRSPAATHPLLAELFADVTAVSSPTTYIFQHYVLGSARFTETFGLPPAFEVESYLLAHDVPLLSPASKRRLHQGAAAGEWGIAILTARGSYPPAGEQPVRGDMAYSPEAEPALERVGLNPAPPLIASGRIAWLARRYKRRTEDYLKPAPVQALAAIGAAASGLEVPALLAAADFYEHGKLGGPLADLSGSRVQVIVFEDTVVGIRATQRAAALLREAGLDVHLEAAGIAKESSKRAALAPIATRLFDDVNEALAFYLPVLEN